uniref:Uncharacterized protein n=1 Tax=viral metagenome TaxID=1070528 RepID=A0A6C0F6U6_9ZZZZ
MKIIINSHCKSQVALTHLLDSMCKQKEFGDYQIIVFAGGYYHNKNYIATTDKNVTVIECNYNSIDLTAFIGLVELFNKSINEYYFYMHDTCKVGDNFYQKLKNIDLTNVSTIRINKGWSMNIGIYSQKILNDFSGFLISKKNNSDKYLTYLKNHPHIEDHIFKMDPTNKVLDNYENPKKSDLVDYYKTGTMRVVEYYENMDLYKIKANYGQQGQRIFRN